MTITAERLRERLIYDPEAGTFTTRFAHARWPAGRRTGTDHGNGYLAITIGGRWYYAHRLVWLYVHGRWPEKGIDHINGDRTDNRLSNLREADQSENTMNARSRHGREKLRGVKFHKPTGRWHARVQRGKRTVSLGYFPTSEEAHAAYVHAAKESYGEFARV